MNGSGASGRRLSADESADLARAAMIARRFWVKGETKQSIGRQLGISRFKVARLLDLAREGGLVHIEIGGPDAFDLELADEVRDRFRLTEVWVTNQAISSYKDERDYLGAAAAPVVAGLIEPGEVVGIGWGRTLSAMIENISSFRASTIVQLSGGAFSPYGESPSDLPRRLAERFDSESFLLHAPLFLDDPATAKALRSDASTSATFAQFGSLTTALLGVGAWARDHPALTMALSAADIDRLDAAGAAAHSLPMFFRRGGELISDGIEARVIGITPGELATVDRRVCVAGGLGKAVAIEAILNSGLLTHLITDSVAAEALLLSP